MKQGGHLVNSEGLLIGLHATSSGGWRESEGLHKLDDAVTVRCLLLF